MHAPSVTAGGSVHGGGSKQGISVPRSNIPSSAAVGSGAGAFGVTLHHAPKRTREQKKGFKLEWKLHSIQGGKKCHACSVAFSPTKRPVCHRGQ